NKENLGSPPPPHVRDNSPASLPSRTAGSDREPPQTHAVPSTTPEEKPQENSDSDTPTATSIFDLSAATRYAAPVDPTHHQEAAHVTCLSDRRRRLCHSHV